MRAEIPRHRVLDAADRAEARADRGPERRPGRGRLSSMDLIPEEGQDDIVWAVAELNKRQRSAKEILFDLNDRLAAKGIDASGLHSKSWNTFTGSDAPDIDLVITVCGSAAGEACPIFPGTPLRAHWGLPDPAAVTGDDAAVDAAFAQTWQWLTMRAEAFLALPFETMAHDDLQARLAAIGAMEGAA